MTKSCAYEAVPTVGAHNGAPTITQVRCITHNFPVSNIVVSSRCPIGMIEDARDEAIATIHRTAVRSK